LRSSEEGPMKIADVTVHVTTVVGGHVEKCGIAELLASLVEHAIVWPPEG
jgi:hypothetical protein